VSIQGKSSALKALAAPAIHGPGARRNQLFIPFKRGVLQKYLLESALIGDFRAQGMRQITQPANRQFI
jgi:DNA-binding NtrC family response regulator